MLPPNYCLPEYGLDDKVLQTVALLQMLPLWHRRKIIRGWESRKQAFVYKYLTLSPKDHLSVKKARDLLVRSDLYLSAPGDFNDPYDFLAHVTLVSDPVKRRRFFERAAKQTLRLDPGMLPEIGGRANKVAELVRRVTERYIINPEEVTSTFQKSRNSNGVSCFTEDPRNLLMWSHYAAGHSGLCLQFDVTRDPGCLIFLHRVNYRDELAHLVWPDDKRRIVNDVLLRKGKIWELEKELRYISLTTVRDSIPFDGRALTGLILGSRFPEEHQTIILSLLDERCRTGLPPLKIYRANQRSDIYGVAISKVSQSSLRDRVG